ncbi:MAG: hypothetical protein P1U56_16975 [Saprospiraceae bacterium]|nr:hypothetical protein [Saprospiraceae bacterium]
MKKILNNSKNPFLLLLLLSMSFIFLSAFHIDNSIELHSGKTDISMDEKTMITDHLEKSSGLPGLIMIDCPDDFVLNLNSSSCTASGELPVPTNIQGLCGGNEFDAETFQGGTLNVMGSLEDGDLSIFAQDFAPGTHTIQYTVRDSCDNVFDCEFEVIVPPSTATVVLKQNIVVSLTSSSVSGEAMAIIYTLSVDDGSNNPCSPIKLEIRRDEDSCGIPGNTTYNADGHPNDGDSDPSSPNYDSDNGESVKFCCEDLSSALYDVDGDGVNDIGYTKVWMRVWDDTNLDSIPGNEGDSYTEAWTYVKVEDKLAPAIQCPADITLTCDMDYTDLNLTGSAIAIGSCGEVEVEYNDIITNLNSCNVGFNRRRWNVVGRSDIFCDQTIVMEDVEAPVHVSFQELQDTTVTNCPDQVGLGEPLWAGGPCDVIGYTLETDTFRFEDGACYKLVNNYTVINWCTYTPNDPSWNGEGIWEHTQVVLVIDETVPTIEDTADKIFAINDDNDSDGDGETCEAKITLTNVAIDPGSENCPSGWLNWQVFVDLWGDGTDDLEYSSFLPPFDNDFNDTNGNGIPDIYLSPTNSGDEVNIELPDIVGSFSNHKVRWKVTDGCNNVKTNDYEFIVKDQTSPTATCQDTITVGISPVEPSRLWAINYISDALDNCSSSEDLRYTFSETPPEDDLSYDPDRRSSNYVLTLNDVVNGSVLLSIYIWDEKRNYTTCETVFLIDPNMILNTEIIEANADALYQNQPNPFRVNTSISFDLQQAIPVRLTIINAASSKTLEIDIIGKKGSNTYALDRNLLSGQGLYYYTLTSKNYQETKKMILID